MVHMRYLDGLPGGQMDRFSPVPLGHCGDPFQLVTGDDACRDSRSYRAVFAVELGDDTALHVNSHILQHQEFITRCIP